MKKWMKMMALLVGLLPLLACGVLSQSAEMAATVVAGTVAPLAGSAVPVAETAVALGGTAVSMAGGGDVCAAIPAQTVASILGRDLVSAPAPLNEFNGTAVSGCQWDGGQDSSGNAHFAYAAVLPPSAFTGFSGAEAIAGLGDEAYAVNGADAEQVWVRVGSEKAIVAAVGDAPNRNGAIELARALLGFAAANGPVATAVSAAVSSAPAAAPLDIPLTTLPRAFHYAGVDFTVTDGRLTNRSLIDPNTAVPNTLRAELTLEGKNLSGFKADIRNGIVRLNFADGTAVEQMAIDPIENGATRTFTISGDVQPAITWDGATLTISEADKEPLTIALTGAETATGQPQSLASGGAATGLNKYDESIAYEVTEAALWDDGPQPGGYYIHRPLGQRFLMVTVHATNTGWQNGVSIYSEQFQVLADDVPFAVSYDVNGAQSVTLNTSTDVSFYFLVPANAATLQLTVAADGQQPAQIPLQP